MSNIIRRIRWIPYRIHHGVWPDEIWALDYTIVRFTLPRLKLFKNASSSYPDGITRDEWIHILDEIIWAFENYRTTHSKEELKRMEEGVGLFGEYFFQLWY